VLPLEALEALVAPPQAPVAADGDWAAVEETLGLRLPADYKALVARYGSGEFAEVGLLTPFAAEPINLIARAMDLLPTFGPFREAWPEDYPHLLYPEPGGLLEWGNHGAGHQLCWQTGGDPDAWPIVLVSEDCETFRYDLGLAELLFAYLSGGLEVESFLPPVLRFVPYWPAG
jgi:SUKH superfamily protein